jgi:hypothetical protein
MALGGRPDDRAGQHVLGDLVERGSQAQQLVTVAGGACTSATSGIPTVRVPVLSNSSTRPPARRSSAPPLLTTIPRRAAREMPATIATGAARIRGQGVATTSTASARTASPDTSQATPATPSVMGTKASA